MLFLARLKKLIFIGAIKCIFHLNMQKFLFARLCVVRISAKVVVTCIQNADPSTRLRRFGLVASSMIILFTWHFISADRIRRLISSFLLNQPGSSSSSWLFISKLIFLPHLFGGIISPSLWLMSRSMLPHGFVEGSSNRKSLFVLTI